MLLDVDSLRMYARHGMNVMLSGAHGVGKTAIIKQVFDAEGLKWKYFSASTLDTWVDFVGIPREKDGKLEMVVPQWQLEGYDALFLDEFNRSPKRVRNAVMELLQFKTINGMPLSNIKVVWTAINPWESNHRYEVEPIDEAQMDRFQVHIDVPYKCDIEYFEDKFGQNGLRAVEWWEKLPADSVQKLVSPRRLDYALEAWNVGGNLAHILPHETNPNQLAVLLTKGSILPTLKAAIKAGNKDVVRTLVRDGNNHDTVAALMRADSKAAKFILKSGGMGEEQITAFHETDPEIMTQCYIEDDEIRKALEGAIEPVSNFDDERWATIRLKIVEAVPNFTSDMLPANRNPAQLIKTGNKGNPQEIPKHLAKLTEVSEEDLTKVIPEWTRLYDSMISHLALDMPWTEQDFIATLGVLVWTSQKIHEAEIKKFLPQFVSMYNLLCYKSGKSPEDFHKEFLGDDKYRKVWVKLYLSEALGLLM